MSGGPGTSSASDQPKDDRSPTLEAIVADGLAEEVFVSVRRAGRRRALRRRVAVAGAALALVICSLFWSAGREVQRSSGGTVQVAGEFTVIRELDDGSVVELNRGAEIRVALEPQLRRVELLRGEAHFQVAKDPQRPFVVTADNVRVRAVGTGFAVAVGGKAVEVIVTEGRIAVSRTPAGSGATAEHTHPDGVTLELTASQRISVPRELAVPLSPEPISGPALKSRLQWRVPLLELGGTPLGEALATFNRHSERRLVLADADLAPLELSGMLRADNVDALLRLLHDEFGIVAEPRGNELHLRRR